MYLKYIRRYGLVFMILMLLSSAGSLNRSYKLALKYYRKGEYSLALSKVNLAIAQDRTTEAMWLKGHILAAMKNYNRAVYFLGYKLSHGNEPDENLTAMGDAYYELRKYDLARDCYRRVKQLGVLEYSNLGMAYYELNYHDSALYFLSKVIELDSANASVYYIRGIVHGDELRMGCACLDFQRACDLGVPNACEALERQNCLSWKKEWQCKAGY